MGTASTYHRALAVLSEALRLARPVYAEGVESVWSLTSPLELMKLYRNIQAEQLEYAKTGKGLFSFLAGKSIGKCYYRNRWCSAAVKQLAAFHSVRGYEDVLNARFSDIENPNELARSVERVELDGAECFLPDDLSVRSKAGRERIAAAKARVNQATFRKWVLGIYGNRCCVTGLEIPELLRASHIVAWSEDTTNRMNPANGLCLSATYDAAFDRHLISFDDKYRMILSKKIKEHYTSSVCREYFWAFEGKPLRLPQRFFPDKELIACHREHLS